jgi:hypothetical protein
MTSDRKKVGVRGANVDIEAAVHITEKPGNHDVFEILGV